MRHMTLFETINDLLPRWQHAQLTDALIKAASLPAGEVVVTFEGGGVKRICVQRPRTDLEALSRLIDDDQD